MVCVWMVSLLGACASSNDVSNDHDASVHVGDDAGGHDASMNVGDDGGGDDASVHVGDDAGANDDGGALADAGDDVDAGSDAGNEADAGTDAGTEAPYWTFVSFPDFLNADIGDVSSLTSAVNSTNADHEAAISAVLDAFEAEHPDFVLVVGDLVNGHWSLDADNVQVFGPVDTLAHKTTAVQTAARLYYPTWKQRFAARGLTVYPGVGDHDVGDNNWAAGSDKAYLVPVYKNEWAHQFTLDENGAPRFANRPVGTPYENTAYAVQHKNVLIVTLDVFRQDDPATTLDSKTGSVACDVAGGQLEWLESVLASAENDPTIDHVIVQGHVPILTPVRTQNSSGMSLVNGASSALWSTLTSHHVDLYFSGEVHDSTSTNLDGVEQVVHGGIMGYAKNINFLVGRVYPDRVELELKRADLTYPADDTSRLWQAGSNRPRARYAIGPNGFVSSGTLTLDKSGGGATQFLNRTGYFLPLVNTNATGLAVHLPFDEASGEDTTNRGTTALSNDGTLVGGAAFGAGLLGNGVVFNAAMQRIDAGTTPVSGSRARATSAWVKLGWVNGIRTVFTLGTNAGGKKWDFDVDENGYFELGVGNGRTNGAGTAVVTDNAWHHLVAVLPDGQSTLGGVKLYIDGVPIAVNATASAASVVVDTTAISDFGIGHSANGPNVQQYSGSIDDVAIWAHDLSATQVLALFQLATTAGLGYDASAAEQLFLAFVAQQNVTVAGRTWRYQGTGLAGAEGQVVDSGSGYVLNLGGGSGFVSP